MNLPLRTLMSAFVFSLAAAGPLHAADLADSPTVAAALQASARQHRPVLLDFHAVWCYSCYYMSSHVLTGADWQALQHKAIVVDVDADSPDGQAWMDKLKISFLPTYVVLDEHGNELGRITAEQPRQKFYPLIDAILANGNTLDTFKRRAQGGAIDAVAAVLDAYQARSEGAPGLAWFATLPQAVRKSASGDAHVTLALDELALAKAEAGTDQAAIIASAQKVLAADTDCQRPYVLDSLLDASKHLGDAQRKALLAAQRQPLDRYLDTQVFAATPSCADQRSAVLTSADLDAALGDSAAETAVLDRAIDTTRKRLGSHLASDRNLADNLWVYLSRAHRDAELDAYLRKLIAAYPHDFVYPYRYGRILLAQGKPAQALPYLAQAYDASYGENRLRVTSYRVTALKALHRDAEARQAVAQALSANGPWFPKAAAALKAQVAS
ncbi:MAG TPA: thioredoxin family protein [Dyella sp.]|uniref:thioredoxin family protein n=1 Tax=Dyella sp. TaxID=1869338 RepID=UPI002BEFA8AD|nr:thioredoxin family protein [Dyella sp.]HTV84838.1 thioredoxin family protein [Dyella sp.]